ncbi:MAG: hypothetical protein AAF390_20950 [Pseudomonadota bacterium]
MTDRTPCRTPTGTSATNIPTWKYEACRDAIRTVMANGEVKAAEIARRAGEHLTEEQRAELGALGWHVTTVRLEMEVRGEIERRAGTPLRLRLT